MRDLARLGFVLLGLFLIFNSTPIFFYISLSMDEKPREFGVITTYAVIWLLLSFIPGCVLVFRNRWIASRLFPEEGSADLDVHALSTALVTVLGVYLVLHGASRAASQAVAAWVYLSGSMGPLATGQLGNAVGNAVYGVLISGAGMVLALYAKAVAAFVFRTQRT